MVDMNFVAYLAPWAHSGTDESIALCMIDRGCQVHHWQNSLLEQARAPPPEQAQVQEQAVAVHRDNLSLGILLAHLMAVFVNILVCKSNICQAQKDGKKEAYFW